MTAQLIADRYRTERLLGRGGSADVWLCHDERLGRPVALKRVGALPGETERHHARALREARHVAALHHPNVVAVFDAFTLDGHVWLVLEHVPSRTLAELVAEGGRLEPTRAARIGADVAAGLAAAHAAGIVHRDVKPSNVLVRADGHALVTDFGIARSEDEGQLTRTGQVTGTPSYFSPELARGGEPSAASDAWALGATLRYALEGGPAYDESSGALAVLAAIATGPPPAAPHAGALAPVLARLLTEEPATRATVAEVEPALRTVADARPAPVPRPARRRSRAPLAVALLVVLAAVLATAWWRTFAPEPTADAPDVAAQPPTPQPVSEAPPPTEAEAQPEQPDPAGLVRTYYDHLPSDLDAAWPMLSPALQDEIGWDTFAGFWGTVDAVRVDAVERDGATVLVTLTYATGDRTEQETRALTVSEDDGALRITADGGPV